MRGLRAFADGSLSSPSKTNALPPDLRLLWHLRLLLYLMACLSASLSRIHTHDVTIIPSSGWPYLMGKSQDVGLLKLEQGSHSSEKNLSNCLVGCGDQCTYRVPWLYTSATNSSCTVHLVPWSPCSFSQLIPGARWKHWQKWKHTRPLIVHDGRALIKCTIHDNDCYS